MKKIYSFLGLIILVNMLGFSQQVNNTAKKNNLTYKTSKKLQNPFVTKQDIYNQFNYVYKKSGNYKGFKVIKIALYTSLKNSVLDTIKSQKNIIQQKNELVVKNQSEIDALKVQLSKTDNQLKKAIKLQKNRSIFGTSVSKTIFTTIVTVSYIVLLALLVLFIFKYRRNITGTQKAIKNLSDLKVEYEEHKKSSLKRFQEVNRKLQDEMNKNWKKDHQ